MSAESTILMAQVCGYHIVLLPQAVCFLAGLALTLFLTVFSWQKKERKLVIQYWIVQNIKYWNIRRRALALSIFPLGLLEGRREQLNVDFFLLSHPP